MKKLDLPGIYSTECTVILTTNSGLATINLEHAFAACGDTRKCDMRASRNPYVRQLNFPLNVPEARSDQEGGRRPAPPWVPARASSSMHFESELAGSFMDSCGEQERPSEPAVGGTVTVLRSRPSVEPVPFRQPITARQRGFLFALARELGLSEEELATDVSERFGVVSIGDLDRRQASTLIGKLQDALAMPVAS